MPISGMDVRIHGINFSDQARCGQSKPNRNEEDTFVKPAAASVPFADVKAAEVPA
jgi:hypothetical protein